MKKILLSSAGIVYGYISCWWLLLSFSFIFPDSGPGSKEWPEDVWFIPVGILSVIIWLSILTVISIKLKKDKKNVMLFYAALLLSGVTTFFVL